MVAVLGYARDRLDRVVALTDAGWTHILARRASMTGRQLDVLQAIEQADYVMRDADHPDRENHYRLTKGRLYLKVCVAYAADGTGLVITAHPAQNIKRREQPRWP